MQMEPFDFNKVIDDLVECTTDDGIAAACVRHIKNIDESCAEMIRKFAVVSGLQQAGVIVFGTTVLDGGELNTTAVMIVRMGCILRDVHYGYEQGAILRHVDTAWETYKGTLQVKLENNKQRARECLTSLYTNNEVNLPQIEIMR